MVTKRKLAMAIIPIFAVFCGIFGISACNDAEHVHTFSEEWTKSTTEHWHEATCDHTDERGSVGQHVDADNNGKCDVCDYAMPTEGGTHTHTFDESHWEHDANTHWHAATCEHPNEKGDEAPHVDVDGNQFCDVCGEYVAHVHKFNEEEWVFTESEHWHPATCTHEDEKGSPAAHNFADGGVCECGVKESEVEVYNTLTALEETDEAYTDDTFVQWRDKLKADGVTDVRKTAKGDIVYDRSGEIEGVYVVDRTVKVKAIKDGDGNALADVWFKVAMRKGGAYEQVGSGTNALAVAKTGADGIAELTFTPIGKYSSQTIGYEILLAEAKDVASKYEDLTEGDVKIIPNRYSIKLEKDEEIQNGIAVVADFEVGETDTTGEGITGTLEFKYDESWAATDKLQLPYKRYYTDSLNAADLKEEGTEYAFTATGGGTFDYLYFTPSQNYSWAQGGSSADYDKITENFQKAAMGEYTITFETTDETARLYYWSGLLDIETNKKPEDGTPKDSCVVCVSGTKPEGSAIADNAFTGGDFIKVSIPAYNGLEPFQLGIKCTDQTSVKITVKRDGDYKEPPAAPLVVGENKNEGGNGYTLCAYVTNRVPISEKVQPGLYSISIRVISGISTAGAIQVYTKDAQHKSFIWQNNGEIKYSGIIRINAGDTYLYIYNAATEIIGNIILAEYEVPASIPDTGTVYIPASGVGGEEFAIKFADTVQPGTVSVNINVYSGYFRGCKMTIEVGAKTYTPDLIGIDDFTCSIIIEIAAGDSIKITCDCSFSQFFAEIVFAQRLEIQGTIKEGETVEGKLGANYGFTPEHTGTYRITLTTTESVWADAYGVPGDVGFIWVTDLVTQEKILTSKRDFAEPGDSAVQPTASAEFKATSGVLMVLKFSTLARCGYNILIEYVDVV